MAGVYSSPNLIYQPISLQEMLVPLQYVEDKHSDIDKQYAETSALANTIAGALDPNSKGYSQVMEYLDSVKEASNELAERGLQADTMKKLLDLKVNYAKQVSPVEYSKKRYDQDVEYLKQVQLKDPYYVGNAYLNDLTPDYYLHNPNFKLDGVSGSQLAQILWKGLEPLSKTFLNNPEEFRRLGGNPYHLERILQYGATPENVMELLGGLDPGYVRPLIDNIIKGSDIQRLGSKAVDRVHSILQTALPAAIGPQTIDKDKDELGLQQKMAELKSKLGGNDSNPNPIVHRPKDIILKREEQEDYERANNIAKYLGLDTSLDLSDDKFLSYAKNPSLYDFISALDNNTVVGHSWERIKGLFKSADNVRLFNNNGTFITKEELAKLSNASDKDVSEMYDSLINRLNRLGIEVKPGLTTQYDLAYEVKMLKDRATTQTVPTYNLDTNNNGNVIRTVLNNLEDSDVLKEVVGVDYDGSLIEADSDKTGSKLREDTQFNPNISISTTDPTKLILTSKGKQYSVPVESLTSNPEMSMSIMQLKELFSKKNENIDRTIENYIRNNNLTKPKKMSKKVFNKMILNKILKSNTQYSDYINKLKASYNNVSEDLINSLIIAYSNSIASVYTADPNKLGLTGKHIGNYDEY